MVLPTYRQWVTRFVGPFDPCPPLNPIACETPVQLFLGFQPPGMEQFSPVEALSHGTLWPGLYTPYTSPYRLNSGEG
ncbi:spore coat associated protein CotJA [Sporolactobacillus sp. Y61]|uniref:Spore coat associated protein CotJA n=1 Tax=Sporolactobacillus sp. Y61 TaxID=3160863 RepID=A0AAU8IJF5_9BACL